MHYWLFWKYESTSYSPCISANALCSTSSVLHHTADSVTIHYIQICTLCKGWLLFPANQIFNNHLPLHGYGCLDRYVASVYVYIIDNLKVGVSKYEYSLDNTLQNHLYQTIYILCFKKNIKLLTILYRIPLHLEVSIITVVIHS